jgi:hypothetical protein
VHHQFFLFLTEKKESKKNERQTERKEERKKQRKKEMTKERNKVWLSLGTHINQPLHGS